MNANLMLKVNKISKQFPVYRRTVFKKKIGALNVLNSVSFDIVKGETLGLVGESGCGKTTVCRTIMQLEPLTAGEIFFKGERLSMLTKKELRQVRRHMQIIYQDPFGSLNPRMKVLDIIGEPLMIHKITSSKGEYKDMVADLMMMVGLNPLMSSRYPHEFSSGQRQRISIARAIAVKPDFLICDEPVSALDVSIQAQIINLLEEIKDKFSLTYLFVAHDLAVVHHVSSRIAVMYRGEIVEIADKDNLCRNPKHPYTKALLSAIPVPDPKERYKDEHALLRGENNDLLDVPSGCRFYPRCPFAMSLCYQKRPVLNKGNHHEHLTACHLHQES
ncbi:MAG: peptide ABC transporter substrate-binding protein [Desulfobacterium sp.]|nr:peptide ABC transporter substrate-binding protein [Desulfobacterium sp.]